MAIKIDIERLENLKTWKTVLKAKLSFIATTAEQRFIPAIKNSETLKSGLKAELVIEICKDSIKQSTLHNVSFRHN